MSAEAKEISDKVHMFYRKWFPVFFYVFLSSDVIIIIILIVAAGLGKFSEIFEGTFTFFIVLFTITLIFGISRILFKREEKKAESLEYISDEKEQILQSVFIINTSFLVFWILLLISAIAKMFCKTTIGCTIQLILACVLLIISSVITIYISLKLINKRRAGS